MHMHTRHHVCSSTCKRVDSHQARSSSRGRVWNMTDATFQQTCIRFIRITSITDFPGQHLPIHRCLVVYVYPDALHRAPCTGAGGMLALGTLPSPGHPTWRALRQQYRWAHLHYSRRRRSPFP